MNVLWKKNVINNKHKREKRNILSAYILVGLD